MMGWFDGLVADFQNADSLSDYVNLITDNVFLIGIVFIASMVIRHKFGKGVGRAKMTEVEAGMESGWATKSDVKATGLPE